MKTQEHENTRTRRHKNKNCFNVLMFSCFNEKGFTLIELLIVVAIILILVAAAIPIYGNLQVKSQLNENSAQIVQALRTARGRSAARLNNAAHGVYFEINPDNVDKYILYQGSSYAGRNSSYDRETSLGSSLHISTTVTGNEVNFSKGLGAPNTGTIILTHDTAGARYISVNSIGMIQDE